MLLYRIDPEKHMDRWYSVSVQSSLLDRWNVVTAWGSRRTRYQRQHLVVVDTQQQAETLAEKIIRAKLRKGYVRAQLTREE